MACCMQDVFSSVSSAVKMLGKYRVCSKDGAVASALAKAGARRPHVC